VKDLPEHIRTATDAALAAGGATAGAATLSASLMSDSPSKLPQWVECDRKVRTLGNKRACTSSTVGARAAVLLGGRWPPHLHSPGQQSYGCTRGTEKAGLSPGTALCFLKPVPHVLKPVATEHALIRHRPLLA
jgi:hypothetical protein